MRTYWEKTPAGWRLVSGFGDPLGEAYRGRGGRWQAWAFDAGTLRWVESEGVGFSTRRAAGQWIVGKAEKNGGRR